MTDDATASTRATLDRFYVAYTGGDLEGMLAMMRDDVIVTFIGHGTFHGKAEARPYMTWAGTQLPHLDFRVLAPHLIQQLLARKDATRLLQEMPQQAELGRAEMDRLSGARDPVCD